MLKKSQRLSTKQFEEVMKKGKVAHSSLFLMRALGGQKDTRIAAVAPQKIIKLASARNNLRRRMYAVIRPVFSKVAHGTHAIIFAKRDLSEVTSIAMADNISALFSKARP